MTKPFPCISCCRVCTALFSESWAMRLCATPDAYSGTSFDNGLMPAGADASIAAYIAGINSYFANVSISFTDTNFPLFSNPTGYTSKATTVTDTTTYDVWLPDFNSSVLGDPYDWYELPISNTRLTFGAIWKTTHASASDIPKRCAPAWWWQLDADIDGVQCVMVTFKVAGSVDGGLFNSGGVTLGSNNADGICNPISFKTSTISPQCQYVDIGPETSSHSIAAQVQDSAGRKFAMFIKRPTTCIITHNPSPSSLPSCPT